MTKGPGNVNFKYIAENPYTKYRIVGASNTVVAFDLRDMKWLSEKQRFEVIVTDPEVLVGLKEATLNIDFPLVEKMDSEGKSKYVVGGRIYFESNAIGNGLQSFTTKGFFDKAGYVEPRG